MEGFSAGEFIQGFLEEAGEHLQNINQHLLRLEQILPPLSAGQESAAQESAAQESAAQESAAIERTELLSELFRSFHTLKGLASMVGLPDAARLSHGLETVLQAIQKGDLPLSQRVVDRLFAGTRTVAGLVETLRNPRQPAQDIRPDLEALDELLGRAPQPPMEAASAAGAGLEAAGADAAAPGGPIEAEAEASASASGAAEESTPAAKPGEALPASLEGGVESILPGLVPYPELVKSLGELEHSKIRAAAHARQAFMLVIFTSSAERAALGENVDRLRQEIQSSGTVIKAAPVIAEGKMRFIFLVSAPHALEPGSTIADEVIPLVVQPVEPVRKAPGGPGPAGEPPPSGPTHVYREGALPSVVRVDLSRLDELMRYAGDLLQLRSRLGISLAALDRMTGNKRFSGNGAGGYGGAINSITPVRRDLQQTYQQLGTTLRDLNRAILRARMVPLAETFNPMPLVVRDLARASQKEVRLVIQGENTEVDKFLVERLLDPLIHLVRNAITHGIEMPEARRQLGKPERGTLTLRGIPEGDHILVEVSDDGAGLDLQAIATRAAEMGWREPGRPLEPDEALEIISRTGFTTRARADLSAGRGVGLDVVQRTVRSFGGQLSLTTAPGQGTTFRMRLPLTLVIVSALFVRVGAEQYAIPRDTVDRVLEVDPSALVRVEGGELYQDREAFYVVYPLDRLVRLPSDAPRTVGVSGRPAGLVISTEEDSQGSRPLLLVDQVQDLREVVVHTVTDPLVAQPGVGGATELGDGSVVLILDIPALLRRARRG